MADGERVTEAEKRIVLAGLHLAADTEMERLRLLQMYGNTLADVHSLAKKYYNDRSLQKRLIELLATHDQMVAAGEPRIPKEIMTLHRGGLFTPLIVVTKNASRDYQMMLRKARQFLQMAYDKLVEKASYDAVFGNIAMAREDIGRVREAEREFIEAEKRFTEQIKVA